MLLLNVNYWNVNELLCFLEVNLCLLHSHHMWIAWCVNYFHTQWGYSAINYIVGTILLSQWVNKMHQQHELKKMNFRKIIIISKNHNSAPWHPKFWYQYFCVSESVCTKRLWMPFHLDNISFSPFLALTFTDFYLEVHIKGSGCKKIGDIVHMSGYVAVKTDCE